MSTIRKCLLDSTALQGTAPKDPHQEVQLLLKKKKKKKKGGGEQKIFPSKIPMSHKAERGHGSILY
jgi:hypothetical protein